MGLSASQARFLGITLRKANCEFKSTELAQQRLELTNQMTDISQEYANALNATKLVWHNEAVCDSFGNPMDYGLSYSLMMMPSAANDYNPYMFSTRSGAIVLNSKYREAAEAAGISMAGGTPTPEGRNKFLASLANGTFDENGNIITDANGLVVSDSHDNVITKKTYDILSGNKVDPTADVSWHYSAGMGAAPKNKGVADVTTLIDLIQDKDIGGKTIDWLQIYKAALGVDGVTEIQRTESMTIFRDAISAAKLNYVNAKDDNDNFLYTATYVAGIEAEARRVFKDPTQATQDSKNIIEKFKALETLIENSSDSTTRMQYQNELENLKKGLDANGNAYATPENKYKYPLYWAIYEESKFETKSAACEIKWNTDGTNPNGSYDKTSVNIKQLFYTENDGIGGAGSKGNKGINLKGLEGVSNPTLNYLNILTLCVNNTMVKSADSIQNMTIADLLTDDITIMAQNTPARDNGGVAVDTNAKKTVEVAAKAMLTSFAEVFGYGHIGTGLNIDLEADAALNQAYQMTIKKFLNSNNAVNGGKYSDDALLSNSAYINAQDYNRMGTLTKSDYSYAAVNLSNMLSAFLTYFDNYLRGSDSQYVVAKGNTDGKTLFVTDDPNYVYVTTPQDEITNDEKIADFFNELYNNICAHGWRYDDMVQDSEYLESAVKDGRYQIMALNNDGYFYQMRYNEIGYMEEVQDEDAIARAESDYQVKKAQITFKEDQIDVKTKKLDAEISELTTEINSVQNIISKAIEKTFTMFSN